jgi:hypothetical protein
MMYISPGLSGCSESLLNLPFYEDGRALLHTNMLFKRRTVCIQYSVRKSEYIRLDGHDICNCFIVLYSWW